MNSAEHFANLDPDHVLAAVDAAGWQTDARLFALNSYENRVYQVGIEEANPVVVKFYRPERWTDAQILEEHEFMFQLAELEIPAVLPLKNAQGESLFHWQGYRYAIFTRQVGQSPEASNLDDLYRIGMLLGRLHAASKTKDFVARPTLTRQRFLQTPYELIKTSFMPAHLLAQYENIMQKLSDKIAQSSFDKVTLIRTHGDCHFSNVLKNRDDQLFLVDFDDCQMAPAIQDVWMFLSGSQHEQKMQLSELIDGYSLFCDFPHEQISLIEVLRTLRIIHYAGWLATRWQDPAFPLYFPWFNTDSYWQEHVNNLHEQWQILQTLDDA